MDGVYAMGHTSERVCVFNMDGRGVCSVSALVAPWQNEHAPSNPSILFQCNTIMFRETATTNFKRIRSIFQNNRNDNNNTHVIVVPAFRYTWILAIIAISF